MKEFKYLEQMIDKGDLSGVIDTLAAMSQKDLDRWEVQNLMGRLCMICEEYENAKELFRRALKQQPNQLEILQNLFAVRERTKGKIPTDFAANSRAKRVLMIAYYFPPLSGSGVFRSLKFAKYLPMFDWYPTVISAEAPPVNWNLSDESQMAEIPEDVNVIRVSDLLSTKQLTNLDDRQVYDLLEFLHGVLYKNEEAMRIFEKFLQTKGGIEKLLIFPCQALLWTYHVTKYVEEHVNLEDFRVVYTTSGPNSAHIAGYYLKEKYGIPWVADYRDMWTTDPANPLLDMDNPIHKLNRELESILLHNANCNLVAVGETIPIYTKNFQLSREKFVGITNGYDEMDFSDITDKVHRTEKFTINYSGLLYSKQRNIAPILQAIKELGDTHAVDLSRIIFRVVGASEKGNFELVRKYEMETIFQYVPYVPHKEAIASNLDSNLLLLFVGDDPVFKMVFTGKIFEYLRSGRPILALAPKDGVVDLLLRETGHGKAFLGTQIPEIKQMILEEYTKWKNGESIVYSSQGIQKYERKALTAKLAEVLDKVVETRANESTRIRNF